MKSTFALFLLFAFIAVNAYGQTWYPINSNTDNDLEAIHFLENNPAVGYIGGDDVLLKTTDFGVTWNPVEILSLPEENSVLNAHDIHFFDENNGYMTSDYQIWETSDGGLNWTTSDIVFNCFAVSMHFINNNLGYFGGSGCFEGHVIVRLEDGTDEQVNDPDDWTGATQNNVTTIEFRDELLGLAGTAEGDLLRTTDGGFNWDTIPNLASDSTITDFIFDDDLIIATHANNNNFGTMMSQDDGLTWEMHNPTATFFYPQMFAAHKSPSGTTYLGGMDGIGDEGGVIFSNQVGTWNYQAMDQPIRDISSHSDSLIFCVGYGGAIYINMDPSLINSIEEYQNNLFQLSPNPTSSCLNIAGDISSNASYAIFDMSGKIIIEGKVGYPYNQTLDVTNLSSGAYTITLNSDDKTGRMVFIKE